MSSRKAIGTSSRESLKGKTARARAKTGLRVSTRKVTVAPKTKVEGIVIRREFGIPRDTLFKWWTEPDLLARWWGPKGYSTPFCRVDLRTDGVFHYCMRSPEGRDYHGIGVYQEIARPARLAYLDYFADPEGNAVSPSHYGMAPDHPEESLVSVSFDASQGKTALTLRHSIPSTSSVYDACMQGWSEMLDRLAEELLKG